MVWIPINDTPGNIGLTIIVNMIFSILQIDDRISHHDHGRPILQKGLPIYHLVILT